MSQSFHEDFAGEKIEPPPPRSTGFVFCGVACIIAAFNYANPVVAAIALGVAAVFLLVSMARPSLLAPLNRLWFALSILLHRIVNPVVMFVLFAVVIVPAGLIMQIFRDPLLAKGRPFRDSYWIDRADEPDLAGSMKDQF